VQRLDKQKTGASTSNRDKINLY
jgi:hypothetical protein